MTKDQIRQIASQFSNTQIKPANPRVKAIVDRIVLDLFNVIDDFDVTPEEYWTAVNYLGELGRSQEAALLSPGLGFDHFIDLRIDEQEQAAGIGLYGGTMLEAGVGTAASAHVFATFPNLAFGTELFGPLLLTEEILAEPLAYADFRLKVPDRPGLGVELDWDRIAFFRRDRPGAPPRRPD